MTEELLHIYDKETGKFMRTQSPVIDPLETKLVGHLVYVQYPNATTKELPEYGEHECPYFINDEWVVKGEWKNIEVYNTENKTFEYCYEEDLGENQVWIDDKDGIKKFKDERNKWIVNKNLEIVENPNYDMVMQLEDLNSQISSVDQEYNEFLSTAILFPVNGCMYKPKWIDDGTYTKLITGAQSGLIKFPIDIWDATELEENKRSMTLEEFSQLCSWLALKQNEAFEKRKNAKSKLIVQRDALKAELDAIEQQ